MKLNNKILCHMYAYLCYFHAVNLIQQIFMLNIQTEKVFSTEVHECVLKFWREK